MTHPLDPEGGAVLEATLLDAVAARRPAPERALALRQRLFARVHAARAATPAPGGRGRRDGDWRALVRGVRVKPLCAGPRTRSVLVEIAPGAALPTHAHHETEECVVLRGEADLGPLHVACGDYHRAPAGSRHGRVSSRGGALLYLRGTSIGDTLGVARDLLGAWLPGRRAEPVTVRAGEGAWEPLGPGVRAKFLWRDRDAASLLLALDPGARLAAGAGALDRECLVIEGEAEVGAARLGVGDHHFAAAGSGPCDLESAGGALIFVHGAPDGLRPAA